MRMFPAREFARRMSSPQSQYSLSGGCTNKCKYFVLHDYTSYTGYKCFALVREEPNPHTKKGSGNNERDAGTCPYFKAASTCTAASARTVHLQATCLGPPSSVRFCFMQYLFACMSFFFFSLDGTCSQTNLHLRPYRRRLVLTDGSTLTVNVGIKVRIFPSPVSSSRPLLLTLVCQ